MKIGVLTSSRADYSIYLPLLKALQNAPAMELEIIAFGTHLSSMYGNTVKKIEEDGFPVKYRINTTPVEDTPQAISESMGLTITSFSKLWSQVKFDLVFCLGDRYEMFAACASAVPFNITLAHIQGGEQTLGAVDDVFRHSITLMARYHFTAAERYKNRVKELKGSDKNVYNVGSLSIDNLRSLKFLSIDDFKNQFKIDLSIPSILITFHPETVSYEKNEFFIRELIGALEQLASYQYIITMPNADTMGILIRQNLIDFISRTPHAKGVESFGTIGYLSCMKHCSFMLGNTSSGFIEASFFPKHVINLGDRQKGRIVTENIISCGIEMEAIIHAVHTLKEKLLPSKIDIYGDGHAAKNIIEVLNSIR